MVGVKFNQHINIARIISTFAEIIAQNRAKHRQAENMMYFAELLQRRAYCRIIQSKALYKSGSWLSKHNIRSITKSQAGNYAHQPAVV